MTSRPTGRSHAVLAAVLACLVPLGAGAQSRVDEATANCLDILRSEYGATDTNVTDVSTLDRDRIFINVDLTLPDGSERRFRCQVKERGSEIRDVRVYDPQLRANNGWARADKLRLAARPAAKKSEETEGEQTEGEQTEGETMPPARPKTFSLKDGKPREIEVAPGEDEGAPTDDGAVKSGPKTIRVE